MKTVIFFLFAILAALAYRLATEPAIRKAPIVAEVVAPTSGIHLLSATYGQNCGAGSGNATKAVGAACDGKDSCGYKIEVAKLGDPAAGCAKSFAADYECLPGKTQLRREVPPEAGLGSEVVFSCVQPIAAQNELPDQNVAATNPEPSPSSAAISAPAVHIETGIGIKVATYGLNCGGVLGNATRDLGEACSGKTNCDYEILVGKFEDPKPGCGKNFIVHYECAPGRIGFMQTIAGEAGLGKHLLLTCPSPPAVPASLPRGAIVEPPSTGIDIETATYGANCGGKPGNAMVDLANACDGRNSCDYEVNVARLGDPKQGCGKDFVTRYRCAPDRTAVTKKLPGEAGLGSHLLLECALPPNH